jgi:hypothetical protein
VVPLAFPSLDSVGVVCGPPIGAVFLHLTIGFFALSKYELALLCPPCGPIFPPLSSGGFTFLLCLFLFACSTTENPQHYPFLEIVEQI